MKPRIIYGDGKIVLWLRDDKKDMKMGEVCKTTEVFLRLQQINPECDALSSCGQ